MPTKTTLDQVIDSAQAPVSDTGRLTTGNVLATLSMMGSAIGRITDAFNKLPDAPPNEVDRMLSEIEKEAKGIQAKAERLRAANR
jgi:hypothetical protein